MGTVTINGIEYITEDEKQHGFHAKDYKVRTARDVLRDMGVKDRAGRTADKADFDYERDKIAEKILGPMPNYDLDKPFPGKGQFDESRGYNLRGSDVNNYSYYDNNRKKVIKLVEAKTDDEVVTDSREDARTTVTPRQEADTTATESSTEAVATDEVVTTAAVDEAVTEKEAQEDKPFHGTQLAEDSEDKSSDYRIVTQLDKEYEDVYSDDSAPTPREQEWIDYDAKVKAYLSNEDAVSDVRFSDSKSFGEEEAKIIPIPPNETDAEMVERLSRRWKGVAKWWNTPQSKLVSGDYNLVWNKDGTSLDREITDEGAFSRVMSGTATEEDFNALIDWGGKESPPWGNVYFSKSDISRLEKMRDSRFFQRTNRPKIETENNSQASRNVRRAESLLDTAVGMLLS